MFKYDKDKKLKLINSVGFNKYFKADRWPEYNKQFFNNLAKKYDATNVLHSFGTKWKFDREAISHLIIPENAKILDLCTGSGDIAIEIATARPDVSIIGLDASDQMLEVARKKSKKFDNIQFVQGDAMNLPFDDNSFDLVIISYGLRNLDDLVEGLKEMKRVTKIGGLISNIDQGKPRNILFKILYKVYFYNIAPIIGKIIFHLGEFNSFRYLPESNTLFPSQDELVDIFNELGLENVKNYDMFCGAIAQQIGRKK